VGLYVIIFTVGILVQASEDGSMKLLKIIVALLGFSVWSSIGFAQDNKQWIVIGDDAASTIVQSFSISPRPQTPQPVFRVFSSIDGRTVAEIDETIIDDLHMIMHANFLRCGGYTVHDSREAALAEANNPLYAPDYVPPPLGFSLRIDQQKFVLPALKMVSHGNILDMITLLQNLGTRYYQSQSGQNAAVILRDHWVQLGKNRKDFSVQLFEHSWQQNSVIATIEGVTLPNEIVIIGAHLDSINANNQQNAPGADDDASGVAVVSEILRVVLESGFKPQRTVQFMAYAAEEVGLRGSGEIAMRYKNEGRSVVAALQMDMTGFQGSSNNMYFINDYVSTNLTDFLKDLIQEYNGPGAHPITYGDTECGYGCSDHVSWTRTGVPAAFPFEATFSDYNRAIHSVQDTLSRIDGTGAHQGRFVKLGIEFTMEIAKSSDQGPEPEKTAYIFTTLRSITQSNTRGCSYANWTCMTNLCTSDLGSSAWRGWAGCWRSGDNYQCYFECGQQRKFS
jgi:bacterial leucyl aminopeptidase